MSRYVGPKCRLCRREGIKLFLKGQRCFTAKCAIEKNRLAPGHQAKRRSKLTDFGLHHREYEKLCKHYEIRKEQLGKIMDIASGRIGNTGESLMKLLESRLDNILYRVGFSLSRSHARQVVVHNHVYVNGKTVRSPSFFVKPGDKVSFRTEKGKKIGKESFSVRNKQQDKTATWLKVVDIDNPTCVVVQEPDLKENQLELQPLLIVEYLTR